MYDIIRAPVVTEKSTMQSQFGKVIFKVRQDATKPQVKQAVEALFNVKVTGVNSVSIPGKTKRFRGQVGQRSGYKKVIVTLADGASIDIAAGV
ncbi:MAG: 50S ribosomal protein L23 [Rickettsiales bacterium]|nr:50S ribosomal protein L23 [Rickettsiales bacterium]